MIQLVLRAEPKSRDSVTLLNMSGFLYDFNLLYEITRLAVDSKYEDFHFSPAAYYRQGRPLRTADRLQVRRVIYGSPLEVVAVVGAVGGSAVAVATAVWLIVQAVEKIANFHLNRKKLRAELAKLEREEHQSEATPNTERVKQLLERREALEMYENVIRRLSDADIRVIEISVRIVRGDSHKL